MKAPKLTAKEPWRLIRHRGGAPNLIGYARVSTREQNLDVQLQRLKGAGCSRVFAEKVSGTAERAGWKALMHELRPGDTVIVLRVDRMGRKLSELVRSLDKIRDMGAHVQSLEEGINTSDRGGRFAFNMVAALAEKVRDDIEQNTRAGLAALKRRGVRLGRPTKLEPAKCAQLAHLHAQGFSMREIARAVHLSPATVRKGLELAAHLRGNPRQMQLTGTEAP